MKTSPLPDLIHHAVDCLTEPLAIHREPLNGPFFTLLFTESLMITMAIADVVQEHEGA